jgi:cytochrome c-type biogenesis protein CcmH
MTLFASLAALLLAIVLAVLLRPLLRRATPAAGTVDEARSNLALLREQLAELDAERDAGTLGAEQHASARAELERRVLEETDIAAAPRTQARRTPITALALGLALPALAVALYAQLGSPDGLDPRLVQQGSPHGDQGGISPTELEAMVERLAQRMEAQPDDPEGWAILARSYMALQRSSDALRAFGRAVSLRPNDAQLLADYADVMAVVHGRDLAGEPTRLVERALQADPKNLKALALAGTAAFQRGDHAAAIGYWTRAREEVGPNSEYSAGIEAGIADARAAAAAAGKPIPAAEPGAVGAGPRAAAAAAATAPAAPAATPAAATAAAPVRGRLRLDPALAAQVQPGDILFIYARAAEGPRMPLAIQRRSARELPLEFSLDDSMAMTPEMSISRFPSIVVSARISRSGQAAPQSGDLIGQSAPVAPGSPALLDIVIDQRQP